LSRRLDWAAPRLLPDGTVRLEGRRRPSARDRGLICTLGFDGERIVLVEQQRTAPPAPDAQPLVLPAALRRMIDNALVERHPMLVAYSDAEGQPVMSFRGSVQVFADDQLAMWIRSADGAFIRAIGQNPKLALVYRNEDSKATYMFQGRARVSHLDGDRQRVFHAAPEAERGHDFARLGVVVLVDLDRVEGYAGLGPAGQVDQIRLVRGAGAA
jgi:Pyridoxamine 5'-phosphate oxidase